MNPSRFRQTTRRRKSDAIGVGPLTDSTLFEYGEVLADCGSERHQLAAVVAQLPGGVERVQIVASGVQEVARLAIAA